MTTNVSFYPLTQASSIRNEGMNTFWAQKNARKKLMKATFCDFLTINKQCLNFIGFLSAIFGVQNVLIPPFFIPLTCTKSIFTKFYQLPPLFAHFYTISTTSYLLLLIFTIFHQFFINQKCGSVSFF